MASLLAEPTLETLCGIARDTPPGAFAEFGVYQGGTAARLAAIAREQRRGPIYLYDTFAGIPFRAADDSHPIGDFGDTSAEAVQALIPDAVLAVGVFPESLIKMRPLAFVHVDADQYESIAAACRVFPPLMVRGGVIVFDDYDCLPGATRAIHEWGEPFERTPQGKALWRKP